MKRKKDRCAFLLGERKVARKKNDHQQKIIHLPPPHAAP